MFYLTLGHSPELSLLELKSLGIPARLLAPTLAASDYPELANAAHKLGGTTRVMEALQATTSSTLLSDLRGSLANLEVKNVAITNYSTTPISSAELSDLKSGNTRPLRFLSFETSGHSLIALRKQHVAELSILEDQGELVIARTVWIQNADDWARRDRKRPYQDIKRGMLPPKIARIMANLASAGQARTLLDPFCGTGTILMEAMLTGCSVIGSDLDPQAVEGTKANLAWAASQYPLPATSYQLHVSDSTHISKHVTSVDCIATEPYLGPLLDVRSLPSYDKLKNIARGLDKLYRGSLRAWHEILPQKGRVVMVIPEFDLLGRTIPTLQIDTMTSLGYNYVDSVAYRKPGAIVTRNITILERN